MNKTSPSTRNSVLEKEILEIFATVTRYPLEMLSPHANLEEDLGIDSVKLAEVFAILRSTYGLSAAEDLRVPWEALSSIGGIVDFLAPHIEVPRLTGYKIKEVTKNTKNTEDTNTTEEDTPLVRLKHRLESQKAAARAAESRRPSRAQETPASSLRSEHDSKPDADFLDAFMQNVSRMLDIPVELLRPDDQLEADISFDAPKLERLLKGLSAQYTGTRLLSGRLNLPFRTLRDIADALFEQILESREDRDTPRLAESGPQQVRTLENKICFLSGPANGLGAAIASHLAHQGATVLVNAFDSGTSDAKVAPIPGTLENPEGIDRLFDTIESTYGGIDFFIANTDDERLETLENLAPDVWNKAFTLGVCGLQHASVRAMKLMRKRGGGKIITLSSPATRGYAKHHGCVAAVKSAVESLTRYMAVEFAADNVQVNCISPGIVHRNHTRGSEREAAAKHEEAAHFIGYLLSARTKALTGSVTVLDGGASL